MKKELLLVTVTGMDKPGITAGLMKIIHKSSCSIVDMGQSVTHGLLSLSILIDLHSAQNESSNTTLLKDLLFEAKNKKMHLDFEPVEDNYRPLKQKQNRYVLSCVALDGISAGFIADTASKLADHNINILRIDNVSDEGLKSLDFVAVPKEKIDWNQIKKELVEVSDIHQVDIAFMRDNVFRRNKRLIVFDMDSTLIQTEVIDEMAQEMGVKDKIAAITERAMQGELDYNQALKERLKMLEGLTVEKMEKILDRLPITDGAEEFIKTVKSLGYKTAILSGGFAFFAQALRQRLGIDYAFANELEIIDGKLTGKVKGTVVNAEHKATLLELMAQQESIHLEQVVAIGDGANDLPMLAKAGLGIAFHAKEVVKKKASHHLGHGPMTSILYFLGIPGSQNYHTNS